jgi:hypothetical protein
MHPVFSSRRGVTGLACSVALTVCLTGCGEEFDPRTTLTDYRVLGIEASPPEVGPDATVELTAYDYQQGEEQLVSYRWTACPFSLGSSVGYACIDEALELDIGDQPSATVDLGPNGLNVRGLLSTFSETGNADGTAVTLERSFDIWVTLHSGPDCTGCDRVQTVKRITVRQGGDAVANQNPAIEQFSVTGPATPGGTVTLSVETDTPEPFVDPLTGEAKSEEYLYTWYTTQGETEPALTFGETQDTELKLPDRPGPVQLFVTVRDGRGGLAVSQQTLNVQ